MSWKDVSTVQPQLMHGPRTITRTVIWLFRTQAVICQRNMSCYFWIFSLWLLLFIIIKAYWFCWSLQTLKVWLCLQYKAYKEWSTSYSLLREMSNFLKSIKICRQQDFSAFTSTRGWLLLWFQFFITIFVNLPVIYSLLKCPSSKIQVKEKSNVIIRD